MKKEKAAYHRSYAGQITRFPPLSRRASVRGDRVRSFPPIADTDARALILGTLPGIASLAAGEYYAHPRNQFWAILGEIIGAGPSLPYAERAARLREAGLALWDVVGEADRRGSGDAEIRRERPNDIPALLARCPNIRTILFNGGPAERLFRKHFPEIRRRNDLRFVVLPSTSPAHARRSLECKCRVWASAIREALLPPSRDATKADGARLSAEVAGTLNRHASRSGERSR